MNFEYVALSFFDHYVFVIGIKENKVMFHFVKIGPRFENPIPILFNAIFSLNERQNDPVEEFRMVFHRYENVNFFFSK